MEEQAGTWFDAGNAHFAGERWDEAADCFRRCLDHVPDHVDASYNLGNALSNGGRLREAVDAYLACLRAAPRFGAAYGSLAVALRGLGALDHAKQMAQTALALLPGDVEALICLGGIHFDFGEFDDAARLYGEALTRAPSHCGVLNNLANTLHSLGQLKAAAALHDRVCALEAGNRLYRYNRALTLLAMGDYARGWAEHEWRQIHPPHSTRQLPPRWRGEPISGRSILLYGEQGLGDTLQFVRYAPMVAACGASVVLEVQPGLGRLLRGLPCIDRVVTCGEHVPATDLHAPLMSLPWIFGTTVETVPAAIPYLVPAADAIGAWRDRLDGQYGLRIGLVWAGGTHDDDIGSALLDRRRSMPAAALSVLAGIEGVRFYSLQKERIAMPPGLDATDPMRDVGDFADTAALVANLDLVIAVDTAVAHAAAAIGRPVWLLSRFDGCWRWLHGRDDTPWYPTMRLYRQTSPGDWDGVMARVAADLRVLARHRAARPERALPLALAE